MKILRLSFAMLLLLPLLASAQVVPRFSEHDLFHQGENGVHTYRIPALLEAQGHVLIAIADARYNGAQDMPNRIALVMRRSRNLGRDWEPIRVILSMKEGSVGDASLLQDRATGRTWCFFTYGAPGLGFWNAKAGTVTGPQTLEVHAMHSDDDGLTWSEPVDLTPQLKKPEWMAIFATSGADIQTHSGRFLLPLVVRDGAGVIHSANAYSDDSGKNWKVGELIGTNTDENHNVELADGSILQNMRNDVRSIKARAVAVSHDGGVSFEQFHYDAMLVDPSCNAGFFRYRFKGTDLLVFTNAASKARERLTVRLSMDNGKSWPVERVIHPGPTAYSTAIQLHDGSIGILYEGGEHFEVEKIAFARFSLGWVQEEAGAH